MAELFMRLLRNSQRVFVAATGAYGLSMVLLLLGRFLIGESWTVMALFATFAHLLWLPALILLPITLLIGEWRIALLLLPVVGAFALVYGGQFMKRKPHVPNNSLMLRVMTHNLLGDNNNISAIIDNIRAADADIVALQEVNDTMAESFAQQLVGEYPYQARHTRPNATQGMALLSRYPIVSDTYWQYEWLSTPLAHQRVELQINTETSLIVYNAHPTHPGMNGGIFNPAWRYRELTDVLQRTQAETAPVLWLGDFNMPDLSRDYQLITTHFEDVYRSVGWGMGWTFPVVPRLHPLLRLDYVFIGRGMVAVDIAVGDTSAGSDHLPIIATLALSQP